MRKSQGGYMIVFIDEAGLSQRPTRVRTWAIKGQSPGVQFRFNWDHISAIAGLYRTGLRFRPYDTAVNGERTMEFLKGNKVTLTLFSNLAI